MGGVSAGEKVRLAVNAAIHLRRPLLVSGDPGTGKSSLAYAIAWQLGLGPVLSWPITPRSRLREDGLYGYDAIGRLYATQIAAASLPRSGDPQALDNPSEAGAIGRFIKLGPVGTAFLPSRWPRVLLIDEIDKADLQLPNELLHLFEEGQFTIEELRREGGDSSKESVQTCDGRDVWIHGGQVRCHEFPIVVMTSNRERDFPPAFHRRCLRIDMPRPTQASLEQAVKRHFQGRGVSWKPDHDDLLKQSITKFLEGGNNPDRAIDQLLNAVYLLTQTSAEQLSEAPVRELRQILQRRLSDSN
jgi:MoxR-like ATPase